MPTPFNAMIGLRDVSEFVLQSLGVLVLWTLFWLTPLILLACAANFFVSLPLRRQERARFFLDLLETALQRGDLVEETLISISESRDRAPGVRFHLLVAYIKTGLRLSEALERVPRFLAPKVAAMLRAGEAMGDLRKVLPACRQLVGDALSQTRGAVHYLIWMGFIFTPLALMVFSTLTVMVFPKFQEVLAAMSEGTSPWFALVARHRDLMLWSQFAILGLFWLAAIIYVGGPRLSSRFGLMHRAAYRTPWKRKRMQRDFSKMLAVLLDAGMPEAQAMTLAADCTANEVFKQRAGRVVTMLSQGVKLTEAVQVLDDSGEFRWRLTNASHAHGGFMPALTGWCEALDAKAYQQEQSAALLTTSALVVLNGVFVCLIALAIFGSLAWLIEAAVLW